VSDWEQRWRDGETPWDKGAPAPPLREFLAERGLAAGSRVLVPGCGSGHDVRELARAGLRATGLDLAASAIAAARERPAAGDERYLVGDFFEWSEAPYDALWEHTCFCAIDPSRRPDYARAAARLLRAGGRLVGVFFLQPWDDDEEADPPPFGASREEIVATLGGDFELVWEKRPERAYPGREGREWLAEFRRRDWEVAESGATA